MSLLSYVPGTEAWRSRRNAVLCQQTHDRLQEVVDGEVGPARVEKLLTKHLDACQACNADAEAIRELKDAIARVSSKADPQLVGKLEDLAKRLCSGHEPPSGPAAEPGVAPE